MQNYPNPFNGSTVIRLKIGASGHYSLRIIDASGRLVKFLFDQSLNPGQYEAVWDGINDKGEMVSSGVYFGAFTSGAEQKTWKMILLR